MRRRERSAQLQLPAGHEVSELLLAWSRGDEAAAGELIPLIYGELRAMAVRALEREARGHTLQPTELVHEVYLRLVGERQVRWQGRAHFFGAMARLMRQILVDHARCRRADKRGGQVQKVTLDEAFDLPAPVEVDLIALDAVLDELAALDERQSRIVELRYFGGLTVREVAEVLHIGPATVNREWRTAKAWLLRELRKR